MLMKKRNFINKIKITEPNLVNIVKIYRWKSRYFKSVRANNG